MAGNMLSLDKLSRQLVKAASVQTIWIVDKGSDVARLVTAYPRKV